MNKSDLIHKMATFVLEMQEQDRYYFHFELAYSSVEIRVQKCKDYDAEKDFFINERFSVDKIEGSERFNRVLSMLDGLVEVQDALQM